MEFWLKVSIIIVTLSTATRSLRLRVSESSSTLLTAPHSLSASTQMFSNASLAVVVTRHSPADHSEVSGEQPGDDEQCQHAGAHHSSQEVAEISANISPHTGHC